MRFVTTTLATLTLAALAVPAAPLIGDVASTVGVDALAQVGTAEAAFIRRYAITKKGNIGNYRSTVVVADDPNGEVDHVVMTLSPSTEGGPTPIGSNFALDLRLTQGNGDRQFVASDVSFAGDATDYSYPVTIELRRADGSLVAPPVTSTEQVRNVRDSRVRTVRIEQIDAEQFLLTAVIIGDSTVESLAIDWGDFAGPEPSEDDFTVVQKTVKNNGAKKTFTYVLGFEEAEAAIDESYEVIVNMLDGSGQDLGATEIDVVVQGLD